MSLEQEIKTMVEVMNTHDIPQKQLTKLYNEMSQDIILRHKLSLQEFYSIYLYTCNNTIYEGYLNKE